MMSDPNRQRFYWKDAAQTGCLSFCFACILASVVQLSVGGVPLFVVLVPLTMGVFTFFSCVSLYSLDSDHLTIGSALHPTRRRLPYDRIDAVHRVHRGRARVDLRTGGQVFLRLAALEECDRALLVDGIQRRVRAIGGLINPPGRPVPTAS